MSFLESSIDKPAVVLDIGHAYTKCGFAGDHGPKCIIKSEIYKNGQNQNIFKYSNENQLKENLMEFIYRIYYKILNINSRDRKLVIVESVLNPTHVRKILTEILFKNFQVVSLFFMPSHLAALYALGINTALVIDCGYEDTQVMPIAEYYLMTGLFEFSSNKSSKFVYKKLEESLKLDAKVVASDKTKSLNEVKFELSDSLIEDIALRTCFVTDLKRAKSKEEGLTLKTNDCNYHLPNNMVLNIPSTIREFAFESIFTDDVDSKGLANLVLDTIMKSPVDLRKRFAENIVLIGGTAMQTGFKNRLLQEIIYLINNNDNYKTLKTINDFKFHVAPCFENYTAWLGAAIFSTLEIIDTLSIQNGKYKENNEVLPDWFVLSTKFKNYDEIRQTTIN